MSNFFNTIPFALTVTFFLLGVTGVTSAQSSADPKPSRNVSAAPIPNSSKRSAASDKIDALHADLSAVHLLIENHCIQCHDSSTTNHGVNFDETTTTLDSSSLTKWEKAIRKIKAGQMPPADSEQPDPSLRKQALDQLISAIDRFAEKEVNVGRTATFRRLTRFEYQNVVRDLFGITIDANAFLPPDEISHGFDNVTVGELPPTLLSRYVSAAQRISRMVLESDVNGVDVATIRVPPDRTQEEHVEGLPLGTRGGVLLQHHFHRTGTYEISIRLTRDRNEHVEGLKKPHDLELLIDGATIESFRVYPPRASNKTADDYTQPSHMNVDKHLKVRVHVKSGMHRLGATFLKNPSSLLQTKRQPLDVHYNMYRHPRLGPAIFQVSIAGPLLDNANPVSSIAPPRNTALTPWPASNLEEESCARTILAKMMPQMFRRSVSDGELEKVMLKYRQVAINHGFEAGIEYAVSFLLIHPNFLFRIENAPAQTTPARAYQINDFELASRLSFFLWSSIPDSTLIHLAEQNQLHEPETLRTQIHRMLLDPKSESLVRNFAGQWLYLRNLESLTPDARLYPNFDDNLRDAFRKETELFLLNMIQENQPIQNLINANHTYLNERLARHYSVPGVFGSHFRKVELPSNSHRGGLLRHGSILSVTSYPNRTSPVLRGKWVLENLIGTPPPPPPENVPNLKEDAGSQKLSIQEKLRQHRDAEACATCHQLIDPIGFALEHYDALGRWRELNLEEQIDTSGQLPDGTKVSGVRQLEEGILKRPDSLAFTLAEKLIVYALGRGIEPTDAPYIRKIIAEAKKEDYRINAIIESIVLSPIFQMRMSEP